MFEKLPTSELRKRWFWAGRTPEQVDEIYEITLRFLDDFFPRYDEFRRMNTIYLSIGSNTDPETNLREMVRLLREKSAVLDVSPVYESADSSGGDMVYLNAAVLLQTPYDPEAFKEGVLVTIEDRLERESSGPFVTADLDIVLVNEDVLEYLGRQIPDPGILKHAFIARPLADIAPAYTHPVTGQTLREIADAIEDATITRRDDITL
ncbi:MAG: 2-amino-4-hydroxy-6-hydroxymethyldihydropteridine diphosphokinase [Chloroflexota bacterium]